MNADPVSPTGQAGDDTDGSTGEPTAEPSSESTTDAGVRNCMDGFVPPWSCPLPARCRDVVLDENGEAFGSWAFEALDSAQCVVKALRDQQRGEYRVLVSPGPSAVEHRWLVVGDGTAMHYVTRNPDNPSAPTDLLHVQTPSAHFDACLELNLGSSLLDCLQGVDLVAADDCPVCVVDDNAGSAESLVPVWREEVDYFVRNHLNVQIDVEAFGIQGMGVIGPFAIAPHTEQLILHEIGGVSGDEITPFSSFGSVRVTIGGSPIYAGALNSDWREESRTKLVLTIDDATPATAARCELQLIDDLCALPGTACKPVRLDQQGQLFDTAPDPAFASTLDEVRCLLRGARDGAAGRYELITEYDPGGGLDPLGETRYTWSVFGDGSAIITRKRGRDLNDDPPTRKAVAVTSASFGVCLGINFGPELFACLTGEGLPESAFCPVCPEPGL